ncbi:nitrogen-specific signal transduction histidine kinase NtrB [Desulfuromonas soudanensis]|uniref:histidine kinase n=1 Tax=Desulfuromonas soudanensis TaxID=1603606 RepID=A0A0M3QFY6_9BACT|nr:HAMP domain-containing sensor histidine kinase [Desulfuromonas soudanensis]ALC16883.1 nitrogen-specific signal transduction histidine kinase NtrB [Desulfuromonas soudanensis]
MARHIVEFRVDRHLAVQGDEGRGGIVRSWEGIPYYEVLPRIMVDDGDAVGQVLRSGRPLKIEGYHFGCLFEAFTSDIAIRPLLSRDGEVTGAEISFELPAELGLPGYGSPFRNLIDIGKSASFLAHGVRNPLNAIKGAVVYLRSRFAHEPTLLDFTGIMEEEITKLDRFIAGFLSGSYSHAETEGVDIRELLKKIETFTLLQAQAKGVSVTFGCSAILPMKLNLFQIEQALLNVLNNSLQAVLPGGEVRVEAREEEGSEGSKVVIEITDNGPGFIDRSAEISDPARQENGNGRGFGLFISREVMKHHGGTLEIKSTRGRGTSVRLCLPRLLESEG